MSNEVETGGSAFGLHLFIITLVAVIIVIGLTLIIRAVSQASMLESGEPVNVLANSNDECVECHERNTPGIIE